MLADRYRKCAEPGCEIHLIPISVRNRFCLRHRKRKPREPKHDHRYGTHHRRLRRQWASRVVGGNIFCHRCGEEIDPRDRWDLDHVDGGGSLEYHGPSHSRCNRATYRRREEVPLDITRGSGDRATLAVKRRAGRLGRVPSGPRPPPHPSLCPSRAWVSVRGVSSP